MIDFSTLKGLTIPEGVVTQIADASGRVLWSAVKKVSVKLYSVGIGHDYAWTIIDGVRYDATSVPTGSYEEVSVPVGTVITCYAKISHSIVAKWNEPCFISVNGTLMEATEDEETISYAFTVNTNTVVSMLTKIGDVDDRGTEYDCGSININEVHEGQVAVVLSCVSAFGMFNAGVATMTINGIATPPTMEHVMYSLNIGDIIEFATPLSPIPIVVTLNGELVQADKPATRTYTYSVKSNVVIDILFGGRLMLYINET